MKKILAILILSNMVLFSQRYTGAVKVGVFNPSASGSGFIIGYEGGKYIDEALDIGWSLDWYNKSFTDENMVGAYTDFSGIDGTINELRAKTSVQDFPLMFTLTGKIPTGPRTQIYITGGIGGELMVINYRSYTNPDESETKGAFDFNWRLGIGLNYEIGRRSDVFGELAYHSSSPSWNYDVTDYYGRTHTFERKYDMSGVMFRVGMRFYY
jgi:hypothetical protein